MKYNGNTTNLRVHLRDTHRQVFDALLRSEKHTVSAKPPANTLAEAFKRGEVIPRTSARWNQITDAVCFFIARDMQPFDTVNDPGFRHLLRELEPRYVPPDRKTIAIHYMPSLFDRQKERIHQQLSGITNFAVTTDVWTSRAKHAYTGLTVHYIDSSYMLQSHLLEVREFSESHTAVNIQEELTDILGDWGLCDKGLAGVTTDNGANITSAVGLLGWSHCHLPCFSHTLQLGVEKAMKIPLVAKALARCRRLVCYFNHSAKACYILKKKQDDLHHPKHALVQDVVTRWNSSFYMVTRVLEQQQPLCATLLETRRGDLMPSDSEFATIECYKDVMKPLVDITEAVGAEKWVTISTIRPLLHKLLNKHLKPSLASDSQMVTALKEAIFSDLSGRYTGSILGITTKAAFLDPRFKSLLFLKPEEKRDVEFQIESEMVAIMIAEDGRRPKESEPPVKRYRGEHKLMELLEDVVNPTLQDQSTIPATERAKTELSRYVGEDSTGKNPLQWWSEHSSRYPTLNQLALKYLCIPATSVPSERAFSIAGHIVNEKRACLLPETVNMMVFLAENLK